MSLRLRTAPCSLAHKAGSPAAPAAAPLDSKVIKRAGMVVSIALAKLQPDQFDAVDISYKQMSVASRLWAHGYAEAAVFGGIRP